MYQLALKTDWKFVSDYTSHTRVSVCRYPYNDDVKTYDIYGATICEVEIDLLTGRYQVSSAFVFTAGCVCVYFNFDIKAYCN
jgi:CO/xanthine dehydrogenase Mo-binding subunit